MRATSLTLLIAFGIGACTNITQTRTASRTVVGDWKYDKLEWDNGADPLWLMFDVFDIDGKTELCGAYAFAKDNRFSTQSFNDRAIANSRINLDSEVLANSLSFMRRIPVPEGEGPYGEAQCILTDRPWKAAYGETIEPTYELVKSGSFRIYD